MSFVLPFMAIAATARIHADGESFFYDSRNYGHMTGWPLGRFSGP